MTDNSTTTFPHRPELTALAHARSNHFFVPTMTETSSFLFPHTELTPSLANSRPPFFSLQLLQAEFAALANAQSTLFFVPMTENVSSTFPHAVLTVIADTRPTFLIDHAPPLRVASTAVPQANTHHAAPLDDNGIKRLHDIIGVLQLYYHPRVNLFSSLPPRLLRCREN
jgi:hypothetical protein